MPTGDIELENYEFQPVIEKGLSRDDITKTHPNEDNFNRYKWIRAGSHFAFNNVWDMVNTVAINVRDAENF